MRTSVRIIHPHHTVFYPIPPNRPPRHPVSGALVILALIPPSHSSAYHGTAHVALLWQRHRRYGAGLAHLPLQLPTVEPWAKSTVWMYAVLLRDEVGFDAFEFAKRLGARGVQTRPFFRGLHEQPVYRDRGLIPSVQLPVTEKIYRRGLYLPSGQAITDEQIDTVIRVVGEVLA